MTEKKISFGFKMVKKQPLLLPKVENDDKQNDIEMIQCLEGQTIKVFNEKEKEKPLIIPLLNSQKTSSALASLQNRKKILDGEDDPAADQNGKDAAKDSADNSLTLEQRVVKELMAEANNEDGEENDGSKEKLTLPVTADDVTLDGAKQSSAEDYERIPIAAFGMAMLRGMGVTEEEFKSMQNKEPELRPKGMGLGADKIVKKNKLLVAPAANEVLEIKKNAYVRILAGKNKDLYGQIEGLDDHACRVIVKLALGGNKETLNEFMVQPVSKQEYSQYGKVINSAKYEEYKKKEEDKKEQKSIKQEKRDASPTTSRRRSRSADRYDSSKNRESFKSKDQENSRRDYDDKERTQRKSRSVERKYESKESDWNSQSHKHSRSESRRSRSTDKYDNRRETYGSSSRNYSRDDRDGRGKKYESDSYSSAVTLSDSDSSRDDRKSSNHKSHHSKKKHKKKSHSSKSSRSKRYDSPENDRHVKKKTKKSKRERSRSRDRR